MRAGRPTSRHRCKVDVSLAGRGLAARCRRTLACYISTRSLTAAAPGGSQIRRPCRIQEQSRLLGGLRLRAEWRSQSAAISKQSIPAHLVSGSQCVPLSLSALFVCGDASGEGRQLKVSETFCAPGAPAARVHPSLFTLWGFSANVVT